MELAPDLQTGFGSVKLLASVFRVKQIFLSNLKNIRIVCFRVVFVFKINSNKVLKISKKYAICCDRARCNFPKQVNFNWLRCLPRDMTILYKSSRRMICQCINKSYFCQQISSLEIELEGNPYNYASHLELVTLLRKVH